MKLPKCDPVYKATIIPRGQAMGMVSFLADERRSVTEKRLRAHLATPRTAAECFGPLFKRRIDAGTYGLALVEAVAHLNHLHQAGEVTRARREDGAWLWQSRE